MIKDATILVTAALVPFALGVVFSIEQLECEPCGEIHTVLSLKVGIVIAGANIDCALGCRRNTDADTN